MKKMILTAVAGVLLSGMCFNLSALPPPSRIVARKLPPGAVIAPVWFTDMREAQAAARHQNKVIFANFTGSDWCPWCVRLNDEVLKQKPFLDYAARHLILLIVDFPRNKWQTPAQKKANEALSRHYGVRGFPTILLLDADGQVIGKTGYRRGGAVSYVRHLKDMLRK